MTTCSIEDAHSARWDNIPPIRPFPVSATRLMKATTDPSCEVRDLIAIVETDPGYAARLMQLANSSLYGMAGRVGSIQQAVVVLGSRKLHDLAATLAATEVFSDGNDDGHQREALWHHSLACSLTARQLAKRVNLPPDEAFLGGILHDVGKLVLLDMAAEEYAEVTESFDRINGYERLTDLENATFGHDHQELGLLCADEWGLPFTVSCIIGYHHNPDDSPDDPELSELMRLANQLAECWDTTGTSTRPLEPAAVGINSSLNLSVGDLSEVRTEVAELYQELCLVCSLSH